MKTSKAKKASTKAGAKSATAKSMKMKDLEPSGNVKGGWTFKTFGSGSSVSPSTNTN